MLTLTWRSYWPRTAAVRIHLVDDLVLRMKNVMTSMEMRSYRGSIDRWKFNLERFSLPDSNCVCGPRLKSIEPGLICKRLIWIQVSASTTEHLDPEGLMFPEKYFIILYLRLSIWQCDCDWCANICFLQMKRTRDCVCIGLSNGTNLKVLCLTVRRLEYRNF